MRIESSVTSISWIPSAAIAGSTKLPFELGVTHYDDPPPDELKDLDLVVGPEGARFSNDLRAWIEVEDGRIAGYGQGGAGQISNTLFRLGGMRVQVEAVGYPGQARAADRRGLRPVHADGRAAACPPPGWSRTRPS